MNKKSIIFAYIFVFLLFATITFVIGLIEHSKLIIPDAIEYRKGINSNNFLQEYYFNEQDLKNMRNIPIIKNISASYSKYYKVYTKDGKSSNACIIFTDEYYQEIHNLYIIKGNFFNPEYVHNYVPVVIGSELSEKLFMRQDTVGYPLTINGVDCVISGIFEEYNSMELYIYAPYEFLHKNYNLKMDTITIQLKEDMPDFKLLEYTPDSIKYKFNHYYFINYNDIYKYYTFSFYLLIIFLCFISIFLVIKKLKQNLILFKIYISSQKNILNYYNLIYFIAQLLMLFVALVIVYSIVSKIKYPINYISEENIFDIKYFFNKGLENYRLLSNFNDKANSLNKLNIISNILVILISFIVNLQMIICFLLYKIKNFDKIFCLKLFISGVIGVLFGSFIYQLLFSNFKFNIFILIFIMTEMLLLSYLKVCKKNNIN